MAMGQKRQVCATRRKRLVHDRRKKIVDRRLGFYQNSAEDDMQNK